MIIKSIYSPLLWNKKYQIKSELKTEDQTAYSKDVLNRLGGSSNDGIRCTDYVADQNSLGTTKNVQLEAEI